MANYSSRKKIIIAGLIMVIILFITFSLRISKRFDLMIFYKNKIDDVIGRNRKPLSIENINIIDGWMTFSYLNTIFNLPTDYLKNSLNISDERYPNISLNRHIGKQKIDKTTFLESVREAVADYLSSAH